MKRKGKNTRLVYSTEKDWEKKYCTECGKRIEDCKCHSNESRETDRSVIYIERSRKGRGGKTVTLISGLTGDLKQWKRDIQHFCATGGTIKQSVIEIQGDHREKIKTFLELKGLKVKLKGG
jgi:translation initiation factor 1